MAKLTKSIEIEASPEKVFAFVNDPKKMNDAMKGWAEGEYTSKDCWSRCDDALCWGGWWVTGRVGYGSNRICERQEGGNAYYRSKQIQDDKLMGP